MADQRVTSNPFLRGQHAAQFANQSADREQLQGLAQLLQMQQAQEERPLRMDALRGQIADKAAVAQRENEYRTGLAQLINSGADQNALARFAAQYGGPDKLLDVQQRSLDRQAQLEQASVMGRERMAATEQAAAQRAQEARERQQAGFDQQRSMAQLAAGLRQPPAPRQLQLTTDAQGNQLIVNPDGTTAPLTAPGGGSVKKPVGSEKPMTEFQGKSSLYGTRAAQSDKILRTVEDNISLEGLATKQAVGNVPVVGGALGYLGNQMLSSNQQRVDQAQRDFVNAVLRQESGAVINPDEFDNAKKQYFPQPGDSKAARDQKRLNREIAISGFARMAGPGAEDIRSLQAERLLPALGNRAGQMPRITGDADYNSLQSGAEYIAPDGSVRRKR